MIYAGGTKPKMCLPDSRRVALIKPAHKQNWGERRDLCATELIESIKRGLAGLPEMENLLQGLVTPSVSLEHHRTRAVCE